MKLPFLTGGTTPVALPIWPMGTKEPIRVLLIDDDDDEASLTRSLLAKVEDIHYQLDWVPTFGEGLASIGREEHDAYLIDQRLGARSGIDLVREARDAGSLAALIILTGQRDRTTDLAAMIAGATDFLLKGKTDAALLDRTLRYAISQAATTNALERSRNQMAGLEELGRILVAEGPTRATIGRVVDLIVERFSVRQVAIYLADADNLRLAGHRGYVRPLQIVSRSDSAVARVARAGQPVFVPTLSPEPGVPGATSRMTTDLSIPLIVDGDLAGLLNIASSMETPIGEQDYSALRLVADRLVVALKVAIERNDAEERLSHAHEQLRGAARPGAQQSLMDGETFAYRRELLQPMLEVAIASAGPEARRSLGLLLVACDESGPGAATRLAKQVRSVFENRPLVRFGDNELAVLAATDEAAASIEVHALVSLARAAGGEVWCGYTALADRGPVELIAAAEAALAYARRLGPRTIVG